MCPDLTVRRTTAAVPEDRRQVAGERSRVTQCMLQLACILAAALGSGIGCHRLPLVRQSVQPTVPAARASTTAQRARFGASFDLARSDDYVVRIVAPAATCSGTLITEDQVLTAHHCVALRDGKGRPLPADIDPSRLTIELGGDYLPWGEVGVKAVVSPECGYAAGAGDLAILLLSRKLSGLPTLAPALDHEPRVGERVYPIGFGRCALSNDGITRKQREGGPIRRVLETGFRLVASVCPGDSGGPVVEARTGAFVGVVSSAAMDGDESTREPADFSRVDRFRALFANASKIAAGTSPSELPPVDCPTSPEPEADHDLPEP